MRFIEERIETSGTGKNRSSTIVHDVLYEETKELAPRMLEAEVRLEFALPDNDEWVNRISGTPVRYWELLLEADVPGVDFHVSWPLPVYLGDRERHPRRGSVASA